MGKKKPRLSRLAKELVSKADRDEILREMRSRPYYMIADFVGKYLIDACKKSSLHCFKGMPYYFDGVKYSPVEWNAFKNAIYEALIELGLPDGNLRKVGYITGLCHTAAMEKTLKPDPAVVTFNNCVFDMDGRVSRKFSPKWVSVTEMGYSYDPDAECTRWKMFLNEVLPDPVMQKTLQEFLGCVFIDRRKAKMEKMLVLIGPGANGKSVVHDVVRALLGEDNVTSFGLNELTQGYELKKNLATLNGKRLNYASEINSNTFTNVNDQLKKLISGEPMAARENYMQNFMATDIPLIMANANKLPAMRSSDIKAMSRRFIILPFNVEIPANRQNPMLAKELMEELPGIFNWVMEGRDRYIANGFAFKETQKTEDTVGSYKMEGSTVVEFMLARGYEARRRENMEQPKWVKASLLYKEYHEWCLSNGKPQDSIFSANNFGRKLSLDMAFRKRTVNRAVSYAIYADDVKMAFVSEEEKKLAKINLANKPFLDIQGRKWIKTSAALADALGVTIATVRECISQGVFAGNVKQDGSAKIYLIEGCRLAVAAFLQAKEEEKRLRKEEVEDPKIWRMRSKFNQKMEKYGEPYRKYGAKTMKQDTTGTGFVLVPDDWDYLTEVPLDKQSSLIKRRNINRLTEINLENLEDD